VRQVNKLAIEEIRSFSPDVLLVFGNAKIVPGFLAYLKSIMPGLKVVFVWPDPLVNLSNEVLLAARNIDLFASYSKAAVSGLKSYAFQKVEWVPLAADPLMHNIGDGTTAEGDATLDVSFVGNWRLERENAMNAVMEEFGSTIRFKIFGGGSWRKNLKNKQLGRYIINKGVYGSDLSKLFRNTKVNINVMDTLNYPAANMRFFEVLASKGLLLNSSCPELEAEFSDGLHLHYFSDNDELVDKIKLPLGTDASDVKQSGYERVMEGHTYTDRMKQIIEYLG